jgi:hypothetical protein
MMADDRAERAASDDTKLMAFLPSASPVSPGPPFWAAYMASIIRYGTHPARDES